MKPLALACLATLALTAIPAAPSAASLPPSAPLLGAPVSPFLRPQWLDPSRLSFAGTVSFASVGGRLEGLQVASLRYQLAKPLAMQVNLGSRMGGVSRSGEFFLEGLRLDYRPSGNTWFRVEYQDLRSPLQMRSPWSAWAP